MNCRFLRIIIFLRGFLDQCCSDEDLLCCILRKVASLRKRHVTGGTAVGKTGFNTSVSHLLVSLKAVDFFEWLCNAGSHLERKKFLMLTMAEALHLLKVKKKQTLYFSECIEEEHI